MNVCAFLLATVLIMPIGKLTDSIPAYKSLPLAFLLRAASLSLLIGTVNTPREIRFYVFAMGLIIASSFENTAVDGLFNKNLRKEIRGSLNGAYNFFGNIGLLVFSGIGGHLYDNIGPRAPLCFVIICDLIFAIICIYMRMSGKLT